MEGEVEIRILVPMEVVCPAEGATEDGMAPFPNPTRLKLLMREDLPVLGSPRTTRVMNG